MVENGSATDWLDMIEVAASADIVVNTAAVPRSPGRVRHWASPLSAVRESPLRGS